MTVKIVAIVSSQEEGSAYYSVHVLISCVTLTKIISFKSDVFDTADLDLLYFLNNFLHSFNNLSRSCRYLISACKMTGNKIWRKTLAVRIAESWNKVSAQDIKYLIRSFQEYDWSIVTFLQWKYKLAGLLWQYVFRQPYTHFQGATEARMLPKGRLAGSKGDPSTSCALTDET